MNNHINIHYIKLKVFTKHYTSSS